MVDVSFDIGSQVTKVYLRGKVIKRRIFVTPIPIRKYKEKFIVTETKIELDLFLQKLTYTLGLFGSRKQVEILNNIYDCPLFTKYVQRWFLSISFSGLPKIVNIHSWLLALYGSSNGYVIDIGYQATRIVPIISQIPVVEALTIGSGISEIISSSCDKVTEESFSILETSSLQFEATNDMLFVVNLFEESLQLCNAQTQIPFVCDVFLIMGGGVEIKKILKSIQSTIKRYFPTSQVLVDDPSAPFLWSALDCS